ncbi:hypothetical protein GE061_015023 [Apolygus lucorum]|uniref:Uncharacterized protein n=1 Tax=Apolygus lucorum TaxID=248454 RepID=A0A8S9XM01_APOLU|nr:hypothetical protein GE061_015023 [Apolygus lucorum]
MKRVPEGNPSGSWMARSKNVRREGLSNINSLKGVVSFEHQGVCLTTSQYGLFHPARKVRDVYWKIYNSLYIGGQDTLVAGYPRIHNDPKNQYLRYELDYIL